MQGMTLELVGLNLAAGPRIKLQAQQLLLVERKNNCSWPSCECVSPDPFLWEEN